MTKASSKPRVFISSTIYDFRDLRSALKYWLEELGFEVDASEFNDFEKDISQNSCDACLSTIEKANYFILLIGSRAGGFYDKASKTTITMQEYRKAYELAKAGKIKIVSFVRQSVWDLKEDRNALKQLIEEEYIKENILSSSDITRIAYHKSKILRDAEIIFNFINEVTRNTEMKLAIADNNPLPISNWIHQFYSFRDIIDALKTCIIKYNSIKKLVLLTNLKNELLNNLIILLYCDKNRKISPIYEWASFARNELKGSFNDINNYKGKYLKWLGLFIMQARAGRSLITDILDDCISSGEFLIFNPEKNNYVLSDIQKSLIKLKEQIQSLRYMENHKKDEDQQTLFKELIYSENEKIYPIDNYKLFLPFGLYDRYYNVTILSLSLLKYCIEGSLFIPNIYPSSPLKPEAEQLAKEKPTLDEVESWVRSLSFTSTQ